MNRRAVAVWLVLFAAYLATVGLHASGRAEYSRGEARYLRVTKSLVAGERRDEPQGIGFPLLLTPAYAVAGAKGVEVLLAAIAALALALAYTLALRAVPDPWALGATLAVGLSPPLLAYSTTVYPELAAAAALCGAILLAVRVAARPARAGAWLCFVLLGLLPWLGLEYALAGAPVAVYALLAMRRARRPLLAISCLEIVGFSAALYVGLNEGIYGGPTPYSAGAPGHGATGADGPLGYLERSYRLVALLIDGDRGLLRWAPVLALALYGAWIAWRERRSGIARAIPGLKVSEAAVGLCGAVALAQYLAAAFLAPTMFGAWFPGRHVVAALPATVPLVALGLRRAPRVGTLLAAVGVFASLWLCVVVRSGDAGLVAGRPDAPLGPLVHLLPRFH